VGATVVATPASGGAAGVVAKAAAANAAAEREAGDGSPPAAAPAAAKTDAEVRLAGAAEEVAAGETPTPRSGAGRARRPSPGMAEAVSQALETFGAQLSGMLQGTQELGARMDALETRGDAERDGSLGAGADGERRGAGAGDEGYGRGREGVRHADTREGYSSDSSGDGDESHRGGYVSFSKDNPHYVARRYAHERDMEPRIFDLYGYEPADQLAKGRSGGKPGILSESLGYSEAIAAFGWEANAALAEVCDELADAGYQEVHERLLPILNSLDSCYDLVNRQRTLLTRKARALGGSSYERDELEYLERLQRDKARDVGADDPELEDAAAEFRRLSQGAYLRDAARRSGRRGTDGGGLGAERDRRRGDGRGSDSEGEKRRRGKRGGRKHRGARDGRRGGERDDDRRRERSESPKRASRRSEARSESREARKGRGDRSERDRGGRGGERRDPPADRTPATRPRGGEQRGGDRASGGRDGDRRRQGGRERERAPPARHTTRRGGGSVSASGESGSDY